MLSQKEGSMAYKFSAAVQHDLTEFNLKKKKKKITRAECKLLKYCHSMDRYARGENASMQHHGRADITFYIDKICDQQSREDVDWQRN